MQQQQPNQPQTQRLPPPKPFTAEWFFLNYIAEWKPEHIRLAINQDIDLVQALTEHQDASKKFMQLKPEGVTNAQIQAIGLEEVMLWFGERRPDLYAVVTESREGIEWLRKNVEKIKQML